MNEGKILIEMLRIKKYKNTIWIMIKKKKRKLQSSNMKAGKFVIPYLLLNANITAVLKALKQYEQYEAIKLNYL